VRDDVRDRAIDVNGKRVTVMGLGLVGGGVGVARYLAMHGAVVTVTDMRDESTLRDSMALLDDLPVSFHLGGHDIRDFTSEGADIVIRNPGVPYNSPYLLAAHDDGVPVEMEMSLFFRACPAQILGVTGTKGKTTVSSLCGEIMRHWNPDSLLAGNMGISALAVVDRLNASQPVVIELSSFQLEALDENRLGPHVAVVTNISEDHLDRYEDFDHYARTKLSIGHHQTDADFFIANADDPLVSRIVGQTAATLVPFGVHDEGRDGAWLSGDRFVWRHEGSETFFTRPSILALLGDHGARNALAAIAATVVYGVPTDAIAAGLSSFKGAPGRMEEIATIDGVLYVNNTTATAPVATIAALTVLPHLFNRVHLIAGGSSKRSDLTGLGEAIAASGARTFLLAGSGTDELREHIRAAGGSYEGPFGSMADAMDAAVAGVRPGDVVALSPGCASFGMFLNEFDRGRQFDAYVHQMRVTSES
jgi:UDP-N-acetylmuramoylalanine--D-glutamate ligase